jgi:MoxR-like ATPase
MTSTFKFQGQILEILNKANSVILDKEQVVKLSLCTLISQGHLLIEDIPGMGKTSLVKTFSKLLGLPTHRIQFTNDMLPADILGTSIWNKEKSQFEFHKGPIFSHFVLADEINRATPKTQSALLQSMEEGVVSLDGVEHILPQPFFLVATQNPTDNYGTFPLPDSQLDRFLMRIQLGYPSRAAERQLLISPPTQISIENLDALLNPSDLLKVFSETQNIHVSDIALDYIQDLVENSRTLSRGLSPRASIDLLKAGKSWAYIQQRDYMIPEDIQEVAAAVMNHRISSSQDSNYELAKEIIQTTSI